MGGEEEAKITFQSISPGRMFGCYKGTNHGHLRMRKEMESFVDIGRNMRRSKTKR